MASESVLLNKTYLLKYKAIESQSKISFVCLSIGIDCVLYCDSQHTQLSNSLRRIAVPILREFVSAACDAPQQRDRHNLHKSTRDPAYIEPITSATASTDRSAHTSDHAGNYTPYLPGLLFQHLGPLLLPVHRGDTHRSISQDMRTACRTCCRASISSFIPPNKTGSQCAFQTLRTLAERR